LKSDFKTALDALLISISKLKDFESAPYKEAVEVFKAKISSFSSTNEGEAASDKEFVGSITAAVEHVIKELSSESPGRKAIGMISPWLPKFIYMDDHKAFTGSAQLNQIKERKDSNTLSEQDKTILLIMEMSGLKLEDEFKKGNQSDREQRMLDMNDASSTLTNEISARWRQKKYEVQFQADGHHFMTFVKDNGARALVPLDERSKGFQWFFSFDMTFMYETGGSFKNAIILLDEPGLHLHADAQKDLLERFKAYTEDNQLIYTTHLPFMIDVRRLDNVWVAEENLETGSRIHQDWETAGKDARFTLQAALGMSWSQSLFVGKNNLVVEGVTDFWFLNGMSALLREAGRIGIDDRLVITPAGGATKVAYVGTLLHAQDLNVAVLLDSDKEGEAAHRHLVHQWILQKDHALLLGDLIGKPGTLALEDLFEESYYIGHAVEAYKSELDNKKLTIPKDERSLIERLTVAFRTAGIDHFNKGRVAKRIMNDLANKTASDIDKVTLDNFEKVATALNKLVSGWEREIDQKSTNKNPVGQNREHSADATH
jgi:predicted ATP-dependent endonuclease of OLD family